MITGKPNPYVVNLIREQQNLKDARMCMVGDRMDTDILLGANAGISSCLVLTGVTTDVAQMERELQENATLRAPTHIMTKFALDEELLPVSARL